MTIAQIAKMAGVSKSTVSRVVNGRPGPSVATVRRVNAVIDKTGYTPAPIGRRRGFRKDIGAAVRHRRVALVMVDQGYLQHPELFAQLVHGIGMTLADHGLALVLANHPHRLPRTVWQGAIDGMLLAGSSPSAQLLKSLPDVPSVWLTSYYDHRHSHVMLGNEAAGQLAAEYLLEHTAGPLGCVNLELRYLALQRRNHAFKLTVREAGRSCVDLNIKTDQPVQAGSPAQIKRSLRPVVESIVSQSPALGGVFCPSDRVTACLYPLLLRAGLTPNRDLQVVSCGNEQCFLAGLDPQPVTVDLAEEVVGQRAVEHLLQRITRGDRSRAESLALGAELVLPEPDGEPIGAVASTT